MGACLHRFVELAQKRGIAGPCVIHLECTELYCFTPFLHEMGVPCVDGINALMLASRARLACQHCRQPIEVSDGGGGAGSSRSPAHRRGGPALGESFVVLPARAARR